MLADQAGASRHGLQDIVEVMGNAPGKLAKGRQLLRLHEQRLSCHAGLHLLGHADFEVPACRPRRL